MTAPRETSLPDPDDVLAGCVDRCLELQAQVEALQVRVGAAQVVAEDAWEQVREARAERDRLAEALRDRYALARNALHNASVEMHKAVVTLSGGTDNRTRDARERLVTARDEADAVLRSLAAEPGEDR